MLTAKGEEVDQVVGLTGGADDYMPKPFSMKVFRTRHILVAEDERDLADLCWYNVLLGDGPGSHRHWTDHGGSGA